MAMRNRGIAEMSYGALADWLVALFTGVIAILALLNLRTKGPHVHMATWRESWADGMEGVRCDLRVQSTDLDDVKIAAVEILVPKTAAFATRGEYDPRTGTASLSWLGQKRRIEFDRPPDATKEDAIVIWISDQKKAPANIELAVVVESHGRRIRRQKIRIKRSIPQRSAAQ
jgi:hypothetical protein